MLYKSIEDVKSSAGFVSISEKSGSLDIIKQDLEIAESEITRKYIGQALYDRLNTALQEGLTAGSDEETLIEYVRRYVTHKALRSGAAKININYSKSGIQSHMNDTQKPAREWMLTQLRDQLLEDACNHLDTLLYFLQTNTADYPEWTAADQYKSNKSHLINDLVTFQKFYYLNDSYSTLYAMSAVMGYVEDVQLRRMLGSDFYSAIMAEIAAASVTSSTQALLDRYLYRICVFYTLIRTLQTMTVSFENNGIKINEYITNFESSHNKRQADIKERELLIKQLDKDVCDAIREMNTYLNANATEDIYPLWYTSSQYVDPNVEEEPVIVNRTDSGFYMP